MILAKELQADQYGIIYATLAGYNSDEIIYKDKNFFLEWAKKETPSSNLPDSLVLLSRKRVTAVSMRLKEVYERIALFQLGVINYHIGRYDDALALLKRFASYFPGREVYSNIGTIYLRMAYDKFLLSRNPETFQFVLSFGVDIKSRAETINVARGFPKGIYLEYKKLLNIAVDNLKKATELDPFYQEAKNSLGCAYIIEKKYYDAVSILEETLKSAPVKSDVHNNLAVAYILLGQELESSRLLAKAEKMLVTSKKEDYTAKRNWIAFKHTQEKSRTVSSPLNSFEKPSRDFIIEFEPSLELKPGAMLPHEKNLIMVEEISSEKNNVLKILRVPKEEIFLLATGKRIRLTFYKEPAHLNTKIQVDGKRQVYISKSTRNGVIVSKNKSMDYFEF